MHSAEYSAVVDPNFSYFLREDNCPAYQCMTTSTYRTTWYTGNVASGFCGTRYKGRDASHHTVPDATGWRPPSSYWGYEFVTKAHASIGECTVKVSSSRTNKYTTNGHIATSTKSTPTGINLSTYRPYFSSLEAAAISACLAELGQATAEMAVEWAEASKTAEMLGTTLWNAWEAVEDVLHKRIPRRWASTFARMRKDPIRWAARSFSDRWMELRYGWMPMIYSIQDVMNLFDNQARRPYVLTARKRAEDKVAGSPSAPYSTWVTGTHPIYTSEVVKENKSVYVVMTMSVKNDVLMTMNDCGVLNPAAVTWELIPFSWMADWVVGIGNYLNAMSALQFLALKGGTATHVHEWLTEKTATRRDPSGYVWCVPPNLATIATAGGHSFNRRVLSSDDLSPTLSWGSGINLLRSLDAVSLMYNAFRGKHIGLGLKV